MNVLDTHTPSTRRLISNRPRSPWNTTVGPELLEAKQERRRAERRWHETGLTVHRQIYQAARNCVTDIVDKAKTKFYSAKLISCTTAKQLFSVSKDLLGKMNNCNPLPTSLPVLELPQKFSDFFTGKIRLIREKLDKTNSSPSTVQETVYNGPTLDCFEPVTEDFVRKLCLNSTPTSCELDPIPTSLLFECLDTILPHVTHIINSSLSTGHFPDLYKSAVVRPLIKKHSLDQNCLKNYRPVSNLSFLSKLLKKIVLHQLLQHLDQNNLLGSHQSAYRCDIAVKLLF